MSSDLFIPIKFKTNILISPNELDADFDKTILKKVKDNYENVCSKYGYIKNNSIKIVKRSIGIIKNQHFNANISFNIVCLAEICNPIQGSIIKCKVKNINKMGVLAEGYYDKIPILEIIIPSNSAGIKSEINLETLSKGQEIKIEVCGKKYQLFDKHISIIGRAIKNKEKFIKNEVNVEDDDEAIIPNDDPDQLDAFIEDDDEEKLSDEEAKDSDVEDSDEEEKDSDEEKESVDGGGDEYLSGEGEMNDDFDYIDDNYD